MKAKGGWIVVIGGAAIVVGSLLSWTTIPLGGGYSYRGTALAMSVFFTWDSTELADSLFVSAGMVTMLLGIASAAGALLRRPLVSWVAGGAATAAFGALIIRFLGESDPDLGLLLAFAGGILVLVGSFLSQREQAPAAV